MAAAVIIPAHTAGFAVGIFHGPLVEAGNHPGAIALHHAAHTADLQITVIAVGAADRAGIVAGGHNAAVAMDSGDAADAGCVAPSCARGVSFVEAAGKNARIIPAYTADMRVSGDCARVGAADDAADSVISADAADTAAAGAAGHRCGIGAAGNFAFFIPPAHTADKVVRPPDRTRIDAADNTAIIQPAHTADIGIPIEIRACQSHILNGAALAYNAKQPCIISF